MPHARGHFDLKAWAHSRWDSDRDPLPVCSIFSGILTVTSFIDTLQWWKISMDWQFPNFVIVYE